MTSGLASRIMLGRSRGRDRSQALRSIASTSPIAARLFVSSQPTCPLAPVTNNFTQKPRPCQMQSQIDPWRRAAARDSTANQLQSADHSKSGSARIPERNNLLSCKGRRQPRIAPESHARIRAEPIAVGDYPHSALDLSIAQTSAWICEDQLPHQICALASRERASLAAASPDNASRAARRARNGSGYLERIGRPI